MNKRSALLYSGAVTLSLVLGMASRAVTMQTSHLATAPPIVVKTAPTTSGPPPPVPSGEFESETSE